MPKLISVLRRSLAAATICAAASGIIAGEMIAKEVPAQRVKVVPKIIYGTDDRLDFYQETNPEHMKQALSTCAICDTPDIFDNGDGTYTLNTVQWMESGVPACAEEPFGTQRTLPFCTGFLVGPDLIATAGHCIASSGELSGKRVIFGFYMHGPNEEATTVDASCVYTPVQLVGHKLDPDGTVEKQDYSVIRLDRAVTAFGAAGMNLRRSGVIPFDTRVGVIGYPAGLPEKINYGANTKVYDNSNSAFIVVNTDTYMGNSGSPVWNALTNVLEGILVRGGGDFDYQSTCFTSNRVPDSNAEGPDGEEASKAKTFTAFIPALTRPFFNQIAYASGQTLALMLTDTNAGTSITVELSTGLGDGETMTLTDPDGDEVYRGTIVLAPPGAAVVGNMLLEGNPADVITATYHDANNESGSGPAVVTNTAPIDNNPPQISNLQVLSATNSGAILRFETDEWARCRVQYGTSPNSPSSEVMTNEDPIGRTHTAKISGLDPCGTYFYRLAATDAAGNSALASNNGNGYEIHLNAAVGFTDTFEPTAQSGWQHYAAQGADKWSVRGTVNNPSGPNVYSYEPAPESRADSSLVSPLIDNLSEVQFYHHYYFEKGSGNFDGGVLEYTINNGSSWQDLGSRIMEGGYTGILSSSYQNPLAGRQAWTGNTKGEFVRCRVDLSGLANVRVRFRFGSDTFNASMGWQIDNFNAGGYAACANSSRDWEIYQ